MIPILSRDTQLFPLMHIYRRLMSRFRSSVLDALRFCSPLFGNRCDLPVYIVVQIPSLNNICSNIRSDG